MLEKKNTLFFYFYKTKTFLTVVLWHGMGDDCCNPDSMGRVKTLIEHEIPGVYVYSVQVGKDKDSDHKAGFFGKIDQQVDQVCDELSNIPELVNGFHAIGFSQVNTLKKKRLISKNYLYFILPK